ncbi:uncharacterized protein LOC125442459 [Sphaerodactylus townsendi]|uniref:uncharacterized protein LOC125442459 n=1 Tax=Sphaerodactylus townsendi TaxID=933632 RepID=UPI0020274AD8|nr:uncharacterized protein LOC125442459 [Sphaerodactylus townsendi]
MASTEGFAAIFYSEPAVLGLLANVISAFVVCLQNFSSAQSHVQPDGVANILAGVHLIVIGGLSQLLAGLFTFRKYDHLGGTAFLAFAALWSSYGVTRIISEAYVLPENITLSPSNVSAFSSLDPACFSTREGALAGLVAYIFISVILSFCSATVNYIMPFVFGAIMLTLVFEAVGLFAQWALVVSGVVELVIVISGLYGAIALLFKGITQRYVLPGFGNPLFNVLLLGSASRSSSKNVREEKKNTKYAEPMALGNLCDFISSFIFAFYCFGYMCNFSVGAVWVSINSIGQILSSFYGYLRGDAYYTTKSGVHSLFWLVMSWEEFTLTVFIQSKNVQLSRAGMVGDWFFLATACVILLMSFNRDVLEVVHNSLFVLLTVSTIQQIPIRGAYIFWGVACCIYTAVSLYATFASLVNSIAEKALIPIGVQVMSSSKLQKALMSIKRCLPKSEKPLDLTASDIPNALFYICNGLAAFSAIQGTLNDPVRQHLSVPTVLIPGAIFQLYVSRLQIQKRRRFGSVLPFCYAAIWATWTWLRFAGNLLNIDPRNDGGFTAGAVAFLVVNVFLMIIASYSNLVLLCLTVVMEVLIICFLLFTLENLPVPLEIVMLTIFSALCIYGATASLANCIFGEELILMGPALLRAETAVKETPVSPPCISPSSRQTSGLRTIAGRLNAGGVCGVPTDTVYALGASCKHPEAIEKIYRIKDRPQEKPICIFISNVDQLRAAAPPFSPLLWEFMENVYPGGIGCIVKKGEWLKTLGVGDGYDRVGTKDSIMIRVPDQTVMVHLIDMTGPLAITSANPSGETDSTHHDMVISRLGHWLDGVLCDGQSNEVVASTVVNCTKIDEGGITILREGCVPAAKVMQIFEKVKNQMV